MLKTRINTVSCEISNGVPNYATYHDAVKNDLFGNRDNKKNNFIFIHGFNVTEESSFCFNKIVFRRMYLTGYRDNFIGLSWRGDDALILESIDFTNIAHKMSFDTNVFHALQSSRAVQKFISDFPENKKLSIGAHSLGNLLMWDALRLHSFNSINRKINNVICIEGAVWSEAFRSPSILIYNNEQNSSDNISYSVDDLEKHSWSHWFRQPTHSALTVVDRFVNSRTTQDRALVGMKQWNTLCTLYDHYDRSNDSYRSSQRNSLPEFAALLKDGYRVPRVASWDPTGIIPFLLFVPLNYYNYLTDPIGLTDFDINNLNLSANELTGDNIKNYNVNANDESGWRPSEHNDMKNLPFYMIYNWYETLFCNYAHQLINME